MSAPPTPAHHSSPLVSFIVGDCLVRPDTNEVVRDGQTIHLEPKAMHVLVLLAQRAGEVVSKDDLHATVWEGTFVSDHVVSHVIWQLRSALGNGGDRNAVIATIAKRGYRLLAPVRPAHPGRDAVRPDLAAAAAVRPDASIRGNPSSGRADAVETGASTDAEANPPVMVRPDAGPQGSVDADAGRATADNPVRSRGVGRVVLVAVAVLVIAFGGAALWVSADKSDGRRARRADPEAVQLYVKGLPPLEEFGNLVGADKALQQFQAAVARDPHFGPAYAGIAMVYLQKMMYQSQPAVFRAEAEEAIARAIAEDPGSADGYMVLGRLRGFYDWDWSAAEAAFERGLARHPVTTFPRHYYAVHLLATGRPRESVQYARETLQLAPTSRAAKVTLAQAYMSLGQNAEAAALAEQTLAQDPAFSVMRRFLASALVTIDPVRAIEQSRLVTVPDPANVLAIQAGIMACAGRRGDAIQLRSQLLALRDVHYVRPTRFALLETCLGNTDDALSWLEQAVEDHELDIAMVQAWRWADPLRGDPRFARILDRVHLPAPVGPYTARAASTVH